MSRIYTSPQPDVPIPRRSIFTQIFSRPHDPQRPGYVDAATGNTLSRADVHSRSLQLAWSLKNILGQNPGATMAIFSPNSLLWPIMLVGAIAAGVRVTTINSAYTPPELLHQLKDSRAYLIFTHPSLLNTAREALRLMGVSEAEAQRRIIIAGSGVSPYRGVEELLNRGQLDHEVPFDGAAADETAVICYSSGTTSLPKGVELSHRNVISILCITDGDLGYFQNSDTFILSALPFYHIFGMVKLILLPFFFGTPQAIMERFDPELFCASIERYKATLVLIVPPILVVLANHPAVAKYNLRSLKYLFSGAAPLSLELIHKVTARLHSVGADVACTQGYGLSETSPTINILPITMWKTKAGSVGPLMANVRARLVLDDGVTDAPEGGPGELWVHGPNVMKGYLNNIRATKDAITPDGWFKTGDIAVVDKDSCFTIVDRKKELIKYKGFQVPPAELEGVLLTHPNILDAAVIGIWSDAEATEYPRAYLVPRGGTGSLKTAREIEAFSRDVQTWMQGRVAKHKYLRGGVVVMDAIPKSASGKILRRELRDLAKKSPVVPRSVEARL